MKEQLTKLMEDKNLSPAKLADQIGVQRSNISHILNDRNKPSYDFILRILNHFKDINPEWLLTGKSSMYKSEKSSGANEDTGDLFENANTSISTRSIEKQRDTKEKTYDSGSKRNIYAEKENKIDDSMFTNVNNIKKVIILYQNGTFDEYTPNQ